MNAGLKLWSPVARAVPVLGLIVVSAGVWCAEEPLPPAELKPPVPAVPAASAAEEQARKMLDEQAVSDKKLREEIAAQSNQHLLAGRELFSSFEYDKARQELESAVQLDRTNEEARKLLVRVNDILGGRKERIRAAAGRLAGDARVAAQERLIELDNHIDAARRSIKDAQDALDISLSDRIRKYEQAITTLERARELMKWMPVEINVDEQSNEVSRLMSETKKAISAAKVRLEAEDREAALRLAAEQMASLRRAQEKKLNVMVDQARAMQETGRYDDAMSMAEKILELDPVNTEANSIIASSRDRAHEARVELIDVERKENYLLNKEKNDSFNIPHREYLVYPPNWREIQQRGGQEMKVRAEEPWKQETRKKLSRRVTFEFADTSLADALGFLSNLTKVNIILDPKVAADGVDKTPITLRVADMDLETALRWVLRMAELEYDFRGQAVFVTRRANLLSNVVLEIYDVRDLTTAVPDFPGPRIEYGAAEQTAPGMGGDPFAPPAASATLQPADLASLIKERLLPAEFGDQATSIDEANGKLTVMQRPEVQERIRQLLRSFRETQTIQVLTQVRFVDVNEGFLETIGVHFQGLDSAQTEAGLPNMKTDPGQQPSRSGLYPLGGGPGLTALPADIQPSPAYQFQHFMPTPPFVSPNAPTSILRPRLDPNFPVRGTGSLTALGPVGFRRQWNSDVAGSPVLFQALTQNFLRINPLGNVLGQSVVDSPQQGLLLQFRFLQSSQANAVLQALRKDMNSEQLLAPKLMQYNNQRAHVMVAQQRSYIRDYDVSGAVYDPTIAALMTGVVLEVRPTVSHDKRYITLDVRPGTATEVEAPQIIYLTNGGDVNNGGGTINLPIELPQLELRTVNTTVTIPDNGTMLFSGLMTDAKIDAKSGIPVLSDLPVIGRFFSSNNKQRQRRNMLILISSRIVLFNEEEAKL